MELSFESLRLEPIEDRIDAVGDDESGALLPLGEEIPHRPIEASGHFDRLAGASQ